MIELQFKTAIQLMKTPIDKIKARIQVAEKELEIGYELVCNGRDYTKGSELDAEQIKGRRYQLDCLKIELNRLEEKYIADNPLPF